jgi:proline dehydrogenase
MSFLRSLILKTAALKPIEHTVRHTRLFRPLVNRFIAGNNTDEAIKIVEELAKNGFHSTLDYLGENTHDNAEATNAKNAYVELLQKICESSYKPYLNISIKLTQCGLDFDADLAEENYRQIAEFANRENIFVRVDMESSKYTDQTLHIVEKVHQQYPNTGTVLQSYLYRTNDDARKMNHQKIPIRIVKGAYLEPPNVAYKSKTNVDEMYLITSKALLEENVYTAIATHDEKIIKELLLFIKQNNIDNDRFEFQMLYGINRTMQEQLKSCGYKVRIYVPYGDQWYPYFVRRLAERPANIGFILKSLFKR